MTAFGTVRGPMAQARRQKRPYLPRQARHALLLEIAGRLVERQGWSALSILSLAEAAGVSRQLVYQHFRSTDHLIAAALAHFFRDLLDNARRR
jgi:AcrR family transcriptional regulator